MGAVVQAGRALLACLVDRALSGAADGIAALQVRHRTHQADAVRPGDIVILIADPLLLGGELEIISVIADGRLLVEQVNYDRDDGDASPVRAILHPFEVELASVWAAA